MFASTEHPSKLIDLLSCNSKSPNLDIVDTILSHLGIADIYALHGACRSLRWLVAHMTSSPSLLDINGRLRSFVKDPVRFRYQLGKHDGLIAGRFVRDFFEFGSCRAPELLVYVPQRLIPWNFMLYLINEEGYSAVAKQPTTFRRKNSPGRWIRVIITFNPPAVEIINTAYTTTGVDFISWNKAYSLFPVLTVARHKFYPLKPVDDALGELLRQDAQYGWTTRDMLWPDLTNEGIAQGQYRQAGDSSSLVIELGNAPCGAFAPDYVLEGVLFSVARDEQGQGGCGKYLSIGTESFNSIALRYEHTKAASGPARSSWKEFLDKRLNRWIYVEMAKMKPEHRPQGFQFSMLGYDHVAIPYNYKPPDTWDYADGQIGVWFQEWEGRRRRK